MIDFSQRKCYQDIVAQIFYASTHQVEAGVFILVQGQPGLHVKFQASQHYVVIPYPSKTTKNLEKPKQQKPKLN